MASTIVMWLIVLGLGYVVARRGRNVANKAVRAAAEQLLVILPKVCFALLAAGFIAKLMPAELIKDKIGPDSGIAGVLIATIAGGLLPSGPIISFPIIVVLRQAGAGLPQIIAFLTAWSVFALHRVLAWEVTLLGWQFALVRMASSIVLPFVAAGITAAICQVSGIR